MTERTPEERTRPLNEDEPEVEVEGHRLAYGPEEPSEAGRIRMNEGDEDEGPDVEGHRFRH